MAVLYHTNGTAVVLVNNNYLGLSSAEGVEVAWTEYFNEIYSDERGPNMPSEVLRNGVDAKITLELWKYDSAILNAFIAQREGGVIGQMGIIGQPMFQNSLTSTVQIASPSDSIIYTFNRCWIVDECAVQLSTQLKIWKIVIRAVPDANYVTYTIS